MAAAVLLALATPLPAQIHRVSDAVKAVMAGASAVQLVSTLLRNGPGRIAAMRRGLETWLVEHEYESLAQMRGSMDLSRAPSPDAYLRANYIHLLQHWQG